MSKRPPQKRAPTGSDGIPMSLEELDAALVAVEQALAGDFALLAERLRSATVLLSIERNIAAANLPALRRPKHRPASHSVEHRNWLLAYDVATLMMIDGIEEKPAVAKAAADHGVKIPTVRKAVAAHPQLRFRGKK
jgi:hypothetical protein